MYIDVGCQGRISDGGVFKNTDLYRALNNGELNLPNPRPLPGNSDPNWENDLTNVPFVFVADDAFALTDYCLKPYPHKGLSDIQRIFNYRLSRFRRITENAFGIWANRFRVFLTRNNLSPDKATDIALATIVLHNMLRTTSRETYTPPGFTDEINSDGDVVEGSWRQAQITPYMQVPASHSNRHKISASEMRDVFANHFFGPGSVPWQWSCLV